LGLTATERLLRAGAAVAVWDISPAAIEKARTELEGEGLEAYFQQVDITDPRQVSEAHEALVRDLGPADTLVNNAALKSGYISAGKTTRGGILPFFEIDLDRFRREWEVNVLGPLTTASVLAPAMLARGKGSIINVVTSPETQRSPRHIVYGPTKAMLEAMTQAMAAQLGTFGQGVRANAIFPGLISGRNVNRRGVIDPTRPAYDCLVPLILWLSSDASAEITGQVFNATEFTVPVVAGS
jgi:3-oxoacyl-[acyl-carrier protein] reductase